MLTITARLTWIVTQLRTAIGVVLAREARVQPVVWIGAQAFAPRIPPNQPPKLPAETWILLWNRAGRILTRFQTLHDRWRENRLPTPRPPRAARLAAPPAPPSPPVPRLPRTFGWVNRRIPESDPPTGQLDALLREPATRDFVQAAPQAGRLLRPLCHALGIRAPDWLQRPRRPRKPRPTRPPRPRPPSHAALLAAIPKDRPLQPYVLAAARASRNKNA